MKKSKVYSAKSFFRGVGGFFSSIFADRVSVYSGQAALFIIIASIPFLLLSLSLAKYVIDIDWLVAVVDKHISGDIGDMVKNFIHEVVDRGGISIISITAITTLWSASRGINAVTCGIAQVYGIKFRENFLLDILRAMLYTLLFIVIIIATLIALVFADTIRSVASGRIPIIEALLRIVSEASVSVFAIILTLFFALLYNTAAKKGKRISKDRYETVAERVPRGFIYQLPGAVFAALGWLLYSYFFSLYIRYFPSVSYIYGSLAAIMILMLWLYFCIMILLIGAEVNKYVFNFRSKHREKKLDKAEATNEDR